MVSLVDTVDPLPPSMVDDRSDKADCADRPELRRAFEVVSRARGHFDVTGTGLRRDRSASSWDDIRESLRSNRAACGVTVGTFDGVHAGHSSLIDATRRLAVGRGLGVTAVTFSPRPDQYFSGRAGLPDLCSVEERVSRLHAAGADSVVVLPFNEALAQAPATVFAEALSADLGARFLCVGEDFACGRKRCGTPEFLRSLGFEVHVRPLLRDARGVKISSSLLRKQTYGHPH